MAGVAPERARGGGSSLSGCGSQASAFRLRRPPPPAPARASPPPITAQRPQRPPPAAAAPAARSALPARRRRRRRSSSSATDAPGLRSECAPVPDPLVDAPEPGDPRVPLLHPATPKMNVRRVESISAQLEEACSTGGRMR